MVAGWTEENKYGLLHAFGLAWPVQFVLAMVLLDGWMYVWHRANHRKRVCGHGRRCAQLQECAAGSGLARYGTAP
jgi:hypothetical protein